ncbi:hypothetical protein ND861_13575 [Leptospira sp. 2 VSF19]|uniref:Acetoacetate decarboxylase n=1 Tax=Leptospira soteropolitanensis TaxID=2950025 RepID=A0AAW5VER9_9LEPT|nr:hypothetical protein [Leptospira soteropolitanensis]MCW7493675.1 hypothetical protein [Leptospira soteropolitanensis]MCW7501273.1 hypothetical protein [Leptospira soteropolitanensis]MCW7523541.1 hypothetical protein [Leptospira soteropolitanensis]MCW7527387.1 hypothetical protein [Leptospira soteropolitanensis]MCW7531243.1 hypothetical protein [Leptospira soteropolitanensis]
MPQNLIITKQTSPVTYDLDLPIHPPYDVRDAFDAIPMQLLPFAEGLTVGWKVSPMQFVDGLGRDLKFDCPSIVITGGQNLGETPVVLYVVAAFYDSRNRLLSCQTSEHIVQPWESYDVPGLWSRFPFPITEIARASVRITSYGWENPRPEETQTLSQKTPKPETKYEWKREGGVVGSYSFQKWNPGSGELLFATEPLTQENRLRLRLERRKSEGLDYLALVQSQSPVRPGKTFDNLVQYALYNPEGRLCHGGSCMGVGNHGDLVSLVPILSEILDSDSLYLELVVWEGPSGSL